MSWTDERVEMLKKLWSDGLSASQIAAQLGGVSRNAVIGKVHRLKLSGRAKTPASGAPKTKRTGSTRTPAPRNSGYGAGRTTTVTRAVGATVMKREVGLETLAEADMRPIEDIVVPISRKLTLIELTENTCKWPQGDPLSDDFHFCGHQSEDDSPYCKYHARLAFQPSSERKKKR